MFFSGQNFIRDDSEREKKYFSISRHLQQILISWYGCNLRSYRRRYVATTYLFPEGITYKVKILVDNSCVFVYNVS